MSGNCCFRWRNTPDAVRSKLMLKIADLLESKLEEFVVAESRDNGKPLSVARMVDIPRAIYNFRFFATSILHCTNAWVYSDVHFYLHSSKCIRWCASEIVVDVQPEESWSFANAHHALTLPAHNISDCISKLYLALALPQWYIWHNFLGTDVDMLIPDFWFVKPKKKETPAKNKSKVNSLKESHPWLTAELCFSMMVLGLNAR